MGGLNTTPMSSMKYSGVSSNSTTIETTKFAGPHKSCMRQYCYRPKPTDGRRQATQESGGPEPLSVGPTAHTSPEVEVLGMPPDLYLVRKVFAVLQLVSCINRHM
jgi:hypothetical protein